MRVFVCVQVPAGKAVAQDPPSLCHDASRYQEKITHQRAKLVLQRLLVPYVYDMACRYRARDRGGGVERVQKRLPIGMYTHVCEENGFLSIPTYVYFLDQLD